MNESLYSTTMKYQLDSLQLLTDDKKIQIERLVTRWMNRLSFFFFNFYGRIAQCEACNNRKILENTLTLKLCT